MAEATAPRLFNIPAGRPFLRELAEAILAGRVPGTGHGAPTSLDLPKTLLLLPTRRACKAMQEAFLDVSAGRALLLPRIRPIGDTDEDASLIASGDESWVGGKEAMDVAPAMDGIERHLILTSLVLKWIEQRQASLSVAGGEAEERETLPGAETPAQASALARGLARLMDMVETEGADLSKLVDLAPAMFSEQWRQTVDFLNILSNVWPAILAASGKLSPAGRRNWLLALQAGQWMDKPPTGPVIVAGVTGSIPATAKLMQVVAGLPQGAVVLAGLDRTLDDASWAAVHPGSPSHPQFRLATLLAGMRVARSAVTDLTPTDDRQRLIGEALRPAATTAAWGDIRARLDASKVRAALAGISRLDAASPEDEAEAVALIMRRAADRPNVSTALVTPDRILARRVAVRLSSWGISIDDSAGRPLSKTPPGVLFDLIVSVLATDFAPAPLMALLKHPLTRLGLTVPEARRGARMLELRALRRPNLGAGLASLRKLLADKPETPDPDDHEPHHRAISGMSDRDTLLARAVLDKLELAMAPLQALASATTVHPLATLLEAHIATAELVATDETGSFDALWAESAGEAASTYLAHLASAGSNGLAVTLAAYPELYRSLVATETVRAARTSHPNLTILGPFEARLLQPDIVILGGLNDGVAPEIAEPDPWLNRPMLAELGLPQPETRIGDAAHDFAQLLSAKTVYLTRAVKRDGAPTVASRWLLRLDAVLAGLGIDGAFTGDHREPWLAWAQNQKALANFSPRPAPAPRPPLAARPRQLSVTRIEHWMANPYAIFARDILRLEPMPDLGGAPEASVRGRIIHQALHRFAMAHPGALPEDIAAALIAESDSGMRRLAAHPRVAAFWRPRFARFAQWFAGTEATRRAGIAQTRSELSGAIALIAPGGPFRLTARADRIDVLQGGGLVITDYKTGAIPNDNRVNAGLAPQLPLEAAIAAEGGFEGIAPGAVTLLRFIAATGGEPPGVDHPVRAENVTALAKTTIAGLQRLIARFDDTATPYSSLRRPSFATTARYDDYAHLARVKEWSLLTEGGSDE
jgi:ATP-dependent helicase/nuclease subunit B